MSDEKNWRDINVSTQEGRRELDIVTAKRAGFYIVHGVLHAPQGTVMGGDTHSYFSQVELEDNSPVWQGWTPRFTDRTDDAIMLWEGVYGLNITTSYRRGQTDVLFDLWTWFQYRGYGDDYEVKSISVYELALHLVIGWHTIQDSTEKWKADRADKLAKNGDAS